MSKYPYILFLHHDDSIESFFQDKNLNCTLFFIKTNTELNRLYDFDYSLLVTYGPDEGVFKCNQVIANRMRDRWIHFKEIKDIDIFNNAVNYCFINNCSLDRNFTRPKFSIFTSCYNSYEKIVRAYESIKQQTLLDYEWVILDDSPDDLHFEYLRKTFQGENKVRLYRRSCNSGNIGNVKNEAVSLCRGAYILELDHDDEILPDVLLDSVNYFEANPEVGFIYMDFINIYTNGENFDYGNFLCKGYGSYYTQKYKGKWVYVYNTPNINNITLSHLVCCPNHPRIWRRTTLLEAGNYSEFLPICDDYEILLRTAAITRMAKISKLGYVQYMNDNNNNFSLIRNSEINRIGPQFIQPIFYQKFKINERMRELKGYEDPKYIVEHSQIWRRKNYTHLFANNRHNTCTRQICIIGVDNIPETVNLDYDYILLDTIPLQTLQETLDKKGLTTFKCFSLPTQQELVNYFMMMYRSCEDYHIINPWYLPYNTQITNRHHVINKNTDPKSSYLEIGVEFGSTYNNVHFTNKIGVDPDPKIDNLIKMTSDDFFKMNDKKFDVVFIDGMHQSEYVLRDFNNTMRFLNNNGTIFIDDILPINYNEQLKIPDNFSLENGIMKYTSSWTGDVWKFVYYLLQHHFNDFSFAYYNNQNYRGVGMFKIKQPFVLISSVLEKINNYKFTDFSDYLKCIKKQSEQLNQLRLWLPWDEYMPNTKVLLNEKFLIIQIPKTSTTTLLNFIEGRDMDCYRHESLSYIETFTSSDLPVYAVVRNPYTQMYSYFFHCLKRSEIVLESLLTLKENFVKFVKRNINNTHVRQYDYIISNKGINVNIFRFEDSNFIGYLNKTYNLTINTEILLNENDHPLYDKSPQAVINLFSQEIIDLIQKHRHREFEMFGYSTDLLYLLN